MEPISRATDGTHPEPAREGGGAHEGHRGEPGAREAVLGAEVAERVGVWIGDRVELAHGVEEARVAMAGFLVEAGYDELLLVRSVWSCCFGQPPAMHEAVVVHVEGEAEDRWFDGVVRVVGTLEVGEDFEDEVLTSIYRLRARQVDVLR